MHTIDAGMGGGSSATTPSPTTTPASDSTATTPAATPAPAPASTPAPTQTSSPSGGSSVETVTPPTHFETLLDETKPAAAPEPEPNDAGKKSGRNDPPPYEGLTTSGTTTYNQYSIGEPTRPDIQHDNGFLQNPADDTDPAPIDTISPTWADRTYYAREVALATAGDAATSLPFEPPGFLVPDRYEQFLDSPDGIAAYEHFLTGGGADRTFSYDDFVAGDVHGQRVLENATADTQVGVEELYAQIIAEDPSAANREITFNATSGAIAIAGDKDSPYPYPATDNWQKAIGGHSIWTSAEVTVQPASTPGGQPEFSMEMTLHGDDRYNFNPDQYDIETGAPDALRGRLAQVGLAHQYDHTGTLERNVSWTGGSIETSTNVTSTGR